MMIQKIKTRRAFTMVELLIVVAISMLLIAIAIPFIRPGIETSRLREATRQINTFIVGAKARAAESGRPFGVRLIRSSVDGTGDPNDCYRMQYVEVPPAYSGDLDNSTITVGPSSFGPGPLAAANPYLSVNIGLRFSAELNPTTQAPNSTLLMASSQEFVVQGGETVKEAWDRANANALISPGDSIRFGFQGVTYLIVDLYFDTVSGTPRLILAPVFGKGVNLLSANEHWPRNPAAGVNQPFANPQAKTYQIFRKPQVAGSTTLELPRNVSIDLSLSGSSVDGNEFFGDYDPADIVSGSYNSNPSPTTGENYADTKPIDIVFDPSGQVTNIVIGGVVNNTNSSVYLHVGRTENVVTGVGGRGSSIFPNYVTGPELAASQNLNNNDSYWVAIQYPTGAVLTAENLGSTAPNLAATRDLVRSGVAKGSR